MYYNNFDSNFNYSLKSKLDLCLEVFTIFDKIPDVT